MRYRLYRKGEHVMQSYLVGMGLVLGTLFLIFGVGPLVTSNIPQTSVSRAEHRELHGYRDAGVEIGSDNQKARRESRQPGRDSSPPYVRRFLEALTLFPAIFGFIFLAAVRLGQRRMHAGFAFFGIGLLLFVLGVAIIMLSLNPTLDGWWI